MGKPSMTFFPWLSMAAIIWLQAISGTNTDFSEYSSHLKSRLGITQVQLNYLAVASDAGKLFGWCSGVAAKVLPLPFVVLIGAVIGLVGYGVPFLFMANKIASLSYWQAVLLAGLAGNSVCWINTACYVASMRKFPADQGTVVGLSTSYSALSAQIYIAMSQVILGGLLPGNNSIYLLLNSVTPLVAGLVLGPLLVDTMPGGFGSRTAFLSLFVIACATGAYSVVLAVVPSFQAVGERVPNVLLLLVIASVAIVPLVKVVMWVREKSIKPARVWHEEAEVGVVGVLEQEVVAAELDEGTGHGARELLQSLNFWLYFGVYMCGGTLGLVYMNNLGQISQSRGVSNSVLLSITSSFGFFGKLAYAPLSAFTRSRYMVSRPALMMLLMAPMAGSFFLLLNPIMPCLFISTAIIGMCSGAMTSIAVSVTAELFGNKHFGVNHNIVIANIPIGSFIFGYIAGYIYDKEGGKENKSMNCNGVQCYHKTFIIWGFICLAGTVMSVILNFRTKRHIPKQSSPV